MRIKCIACEVLARPLYWCAAQSPHIVDITLLKRGLHNHPAKLRERLQTEIDQAAGEGCQAVVLAYGLCGQATAALAAREIPLVVPKAHDCITLFLGSRERYRAQFDQCPGTYWYMLDYMERNDDPNSSLALGTGSDVDMRAEYDRYVEKYGQDNADYLMEVMGAWRAHYSRAAYIDMGVGDGREIEAQTQAEASRRGWKYENIAGDLVLIRKLLDGDWSEDFLVVQPGRQVGMTYDDEVINSQPWIRPGSETADR